MITIDKALIKSIYIKRNKNSHKGNYGHALLIAGSKNKMGAALITSKACLRSGTGLLTVSIPEEERNALIAFLVNHLFYQKQCFLLETTSLIFHCLMLLELDLD